MNKITCSNFRVIFLVTMLDAHGFWYLRDAETNAWTSEHDDALVFLSEQDASNVATVIDNKAGVLCSADNKG